MWASAFFLIWRRAENRESKVWKIAYSKVLVYIEKEVIVRKYFTCGSEITVPDAEFSETARLVIIQY